MNITLLFSGKPELLEVVKEAREERKRQEEILCHTPPGKAL